jgi:hypothetical protein
LVLIPRFKTNNNKVGTVKINSKVGMVKINIRAGMVRIRILITKVDGVNKVSIIIRINLIIKVLIMGLPQDGVISIIQETFGVVQILIIGITHSV